MKKAFILVACFIILALAVSCDGPLMESITGLKSADSSVLIRLAGTDGRTVMPVEPQFSSFELTLINGDNELTPDASDINGAGVTVNVTEGTWTIILKGYQIINGKSLLAAQGHETLNVTADRNKYTVSITLEPIAIDGSVDNGLFSFNITLPEGVDSAILNIDCESFDLLNSVTGSISLAPGYYDLSVFLAKNGQSAGIFESVHIYSGLESPANLDLSYIIFTDKVYLAGQLGGIRIGTIVITNEDGNIIKTIQLNSSAEKRSDLWLADIPSVNIGEKIFIALEFNGETAVTEISELAANGNTDIDLTLAPASAKYIDLAGWYSEKNTNGIEIEFGFDVTVNFIRVKNNSSIENIILPNVVTAKGFKASDYASGSVTGFELYNAADRSGLITAIDAAQVECDSAIISVNGKEYKSSTLWVTSAEKAAYQNAINDAITAKYNPVLTDAEISGAEAVLAAAAAVFENAKKPGAYKVDKSPLEQAIANANAKMTGVIKAANGSTTLNTALWASFEMFAALETAVANAQAYVNSADNNEDDQSVVTAETAALNSATAAFVPQNGSLIETVFGFSYTFNGPQDETITLAMANAVISWVKGDKLTVNVAQAFDSYQWYVDGKAIAGATGNSITLNARDYSVTTHNLTLRVTKNGAPYTKTLTFKVE
ncbi:MAG: hypothetical protein FWB95_08235 [Treponema sp.]|nr:hypothetical protein [Treponema sp.]